MIGIRIVAIGVSAVILALAGCASKEQQYSKHMQKAQDFFAREDLDKAMVEVRNAIQIDPRAAPPLHLAGLIDEKAQNWSRAYANFNRALELDPQLHASAVRMARLQMFGRDLAGAEKRLNEVLANKPDDPDAQAVLARLRAIRGDLDRALNEANRVLAQQPGHVEAATVAGAVLLQQNNVQQAQSVLQNALNTNPQSLEIRAALGAALARSADRQALEQNLKSMVELAPKRFEYRAALAQFYVRTGQNDQAEQTLKDAIAANKDDDQRYIALADLITARDGADAAIKALEGFVAARPKAHTLRLKIAQLYTGTARPESAIKVYQEVVEKEKSGPIAQQARLMLASNNLVTGRRDESEKLIGEVLKENPRDHAALLARAQFAMSRKDFISAINDLRAALKDQPESVQVVSLLANAHRLNNEPALGRDVITSAIKLLPDNKELRLVQADYLQATGNASAALRELEEVIKQDPKFIRAYEVKAAFHIRAKEPAAAERTFAALKSALPDNPIGAYRLGLTFAAQNKFDLAVRELESALAKAPNSREAVAALVTIYARQGKIDEAVARTQRIAKEQPNALVPQLLLGDLQTAAKRFDQAEAAFNRARELAPKTSGPYLGLARMHSLRGDRERASGLLEQARKEIPNDPSLMLALGEVYQRVGDVEKAIAQYENVVKHNPGNELAANNLAFLLADQRTDKSDLDRALTLAKRFEESTNAAFLNTVGWVYSKRGEHDQALAYLRKAHELFPDSPNYMYHLGATLLKTGDSAQGRTLIKRAIDSAEEFGEREQARKLLASG